MTLLLASHEASLRHETGRGHPERAARVPAVIDGVRGSGLSIVDVAPAMASVDLVAGVHSRSYIGELERFLASGGGALDLDTRAGEASWEAALRAASAGADLCERLVAGEGSLGYVAMRPPGHHALRDRAMGFCLFNNVAITAAHLLEQGDRVAIVDWDVHHGNGTQDIFYEDPAVLYISIHQEAIYPGSGRVGEVGSGAAAGTNLNIPVPAGTGGAFYRRALTELISPLIAEFAADWLLVSCGYDAHLADPLASLRLLADDYGAMAKSLAAVSSPARAVLFLEGGYDLQAIEESARCTVLGWLDDGYSQSTETAGSDPLDRLAAAGRVAGRFWSSAAEWQ